jgi:hypothetical protein
MDVLGVLLGWDFALRKRFLDKALVKVQMQDDFLEVLSGRFAIKPNRPLADTGGMFIPTLAMLLHEYVVRSHPVLTEWACDPVHKQLAAFRMEAMFCASPLTIPAMR